MPGAVRQPTDVEQAAPASEEDERTLAKVLRTLDFLGRGLNRDAVKALFSEPLLEITMERMQALQALPWAQGGSTTSPTTNPS